MTPIDLFERRLPDGLADLADARMPSYLDDILEATSRTRQRPRWTFFERWLPLSLITVAPRSAPLRAAWLLLITGLLLAALVTSLLIAGSGLLRREPDALSAMVPSLVLDESFDTASIEGLSAPAGIDVDVDGNLYIVNTGTHQIIVLDPTGREVGRWGEEGSGDGQFLFQKDPADPLASLGGVAIAPDGSVYVADMVNDRVQQFTSDGVFVRAWGGYGAEDGRFLEPFDIAVGPDGSVYVIDDLRDDVQRFSADGAWLQTIGRHGSADGEMDSTGGITVDPQGMLLNADYGNQRVQAWDADGAFAWARGGPTDPGAFVDPGDVDVDLEGRVLVADRDGIKVFTDGPLPDSVWSSPEWVYGWLAVAADGAVYASSPATDRVHRLAFELREPEPAIASVGPAQVSPPPSSMSPSSSPVVGGPTRVSVGSVFRVPFSADLPSTTIGMPGSRGWWLEEESPGKVSFEFLRGDEMTPAYVGVYLPAGVIRDPCHPDDGMLTTSGDPSVDELVDALTRQVGVRAGPVTDVQFGPYQGKLLELDNNIDSSQCSDDPWLPQYTFHAAGPDDPAVEEVRGFSGTHQRIAIIDVDGVPVLIEAFHWQAHRDEVLEANALFDSIRFEQS